MSELVKKWQTCPRFKSNILFGTIAELAGCVSFWTLRCHKLVREVNEEYGIMKPETLNKVAWSSNIILKSIGLGLYIKALYDYKKC